MAGLQVVPVKCDDAGNLDLADLKAKAEQYKDTLSCSMVNIVVVVVDDQRP